MGERFRPRVICKRCNSPFSLKVDYDKDRIGELHAVAPVVGQCPNCGKTESYGGQEMTRDQPAVADITDPRWEIPLRQLADWPKHNAMPGSPEATSAQLILFTRVALEAAGTLAKAAGDSLAAADAAAKAAESTAKAIRWLVVATFAIVFVEVLRWLVDNAR